MSVTLSRPLRSACRIDIRKCVEIVSCDLLQISARAHSCLSIVARDVQLCDVMLCDQQQRHNVWGPVTQHVMSCHTSHDVMSSSALCHATKCMMPCIGMHYFISCNALCHDRKRVAPWHAMRDAWCNVWCHVIERVMPCHHTDKHDTCVTHKYTHGGFCIEQTTVSWRTRIYAKNCKKCGKNISISCHVENIAMW